MDNCKTCGAALRTGEAVFCKSCRQTATENPPVEQAVATLESLPADCQCGIEVATGRRLQGPNCPVHKVAPKPKKATAKKR